MMNNNAHASRTGMANSIIVALLYGFAPAVLLMMALYAGFCA